MQCIVFILYSDKVKNKSMKIIIKVLLKFNQNKLARTVVLEVLDTIALKPRLHGSGQIFARTKTYTVLPCVYTGPVELDEFLNG